MSSGGTGWSAEAGPGDGYDPDDFGIDPDYQYPARPDGYAQPSQARHASPADGWSSFDADPYRQDQGQSQPGGYAPSPSYNDLGYESDPNSYRPGHANGVGPRDPGYGTAGQGTGSYGAASPDPASYESPSYDSPSYDSPSYDGRSYGSHGGPGYDSPSYDSPSYDRTGYQSPGNTSTGYDSAGYGPGDVSHGGRPYSSPSSAGSDYSGAGYDGAGHGGVGHDGVGHDGAGHDRAGYDTARYDRAGYDRAGHDSAGYDSAGYDSAGYDSAGYDSAGYDSAGYDSASRDRAGYHQSGYGEVGSPGGAGRGQAGLDQTGYGAGQAGYGQGSYGQPSYDESSSDARSDSRSGYDGPGYERPGYDRSGYDRSGYDQAGYDQAGYDQAGQAGGDPYPQDGYGSAQSYPDSRDGTGQPTASYQVAGASGGDSRSAVQPGDDWPGGQDAGAHHWPDTGSLASPDTGSFGPADPGVYGRADSGGFDRPDAGSFDEPDSLTFAANGSGRRTGGQLPQRDAGREPWSGGENWSPQEPDDDWHEEDGESSGLLSRFGRGGHGDGGSGGGGRRARRAKRQRRGRGKVAFVASLLAVVLIVGAGLGYGYHLYSAWRTSRYGDYTGSGNGKVQFIVPDGAALSALGPALVKAGVIEEVRPFDSAAAGAASASTLQPGVYLLHHHMSAALAVSYLLSAAHRLKDQVTIIEGMRASKIAQILSHETGIPVSQFTQLIDHPSQLGLPSWASGAKTAEGFLFPDTYSLLPKESALQILRTMVSEFNTQVNGINIVSESHKVYTDPWHVLIVASMVQAEAGSVSNFGPIARVVWNRLQRTMPLEFDSTVFYAMGTYGTALTAAQEKFKSPYNTYAHTGLPPGPIGNPGIAAIEATLHPPKGDWLYFITDTRHKPYITHFTASLAQLQAWQQQFGN
jgi:UPF0755 protein